MGDIQYHWHAIIAVATKKIRIIKEIKYCASKIRKLDFDEKNFFSILELNRHILEIISSYHNNILLYIHWNKCILDWLQTKKLVSEELKKLYNIY